MRKPFTTDQLAGYRCPVHVSGWNPATQFLYVSTAPDGKHHLITPKTKRRFETYEPLYPTLKNAHHTAHNK